MSRIIHIGLVTALLCVASAAAMAANAGAGLPVADFRGICQRAAAHAEASQDVPKDLLQAISFTESGQWDAEQEAIFAWPWTVTSGGKGRFFPDKQSAIAHVRNLQNNGVRNIDVGCMQVNLHYHPDAFDSLDAAFDPKTNALYAAKFLRQLHRSNKSWSVAISRYHSADPERGASYRQRVMNFWSKSKRSVAKAYRQSVIEAYKQRRAERQRERNLRLMARSR